MLQRGHVASSQMGTRTRLDTASIAVGLRLNAAGLEGLALRNATLA
jgi:hypothetical protein